MGRNTIYHRNWTEANGWVWRLEIVPASSNIPESWDYELIDHLGINNVSEISMKFDKLPVGAAEAESVKISFDLRWLSSDLAEYLINPYVDENGASINGTIAFSVGWLLAHRRRAIPVATT